MLGAMDGVVFSSRSPRLNSVRCAPVAFHSSENVDAIARHAAQQDEAMPQYPRNHPRGEHDFPGLKVIHGRQLHRKGTDESSSNTTPPRYLACRTGSSGSVAALLPVVAQTQKFPQTRQGILHCEASFGGTRHGVSVPARNLVYRQDYRTPAGPPSRHIPTLLRSVGENRHPRRVH